MLVVVLGIKEETSLATTFDEYVDVEKNRGPSCLKSKPDIFVAAVRLIVVTILREGEEQKMEINCENK